MSTGLACSGLPIAGFGSPIKNSSSNPVVVPVYLKLKACTFGFVGLFSSFFGSISAGLWKVDSWPPTDSAKSAAEMAALPLACSCGVLAEASELALMRAKVMSALSKRFFL